VPTRETAIAYQSFSSNSPLFFQPYGQQTPTLWDRPASVTIYGNVGGVSTEVAATNYLYDQVATSSATAIDHDETNYSSSGTTPRGNATTKLAWCLQAGCASANTTYTYDETGQVTSVTNPNGNQTTYSYTDSWFNTNSGGFTTTAGSPPGNTNAYLTLVTYPTTAGISHKESFSYGYNNGQLTQLNDENGEQNTYYYNDKWSRPTEVTYPDGGQTTYAYNDSSYLLNTPSVPSPSDTTTKLITSGVNLLTLTAMDGVGHPVQNQLVSDPAGIDYTFKTYDGLGHLHSATNPYRTTADSTYGITTYTYDALGRVTGVSDPDGSAAQTSYCGPSTLATDEAGRWRRSTSDGLGRLIEVDEPNSSTATVTACPTGGDPIVPTKYAYNTLNNLNTVLQNSSRQRTFTYDSLSRLLTSFNPESNPGSGVPTTVSGAATGSLVLSGSGSCYFTVTIGPSFSTGLQGGETFPEVLAALTSALNGSSSPVTATASGDTISLTSKLIGSGGNYSLNATSKFSVCTITPSGPNLVGGTASGVGPPV
jgi:YD repeat-containing protein